MLQRLIEGLHSPESRSRRTGQTHSGEGALNAVYMSFTVHMKQKCVTPDVHVHSCTKDMYMYMYIVHNVYKYPGIKAVSHCIIIMYTYMYMYISTSVICNLVYICVS